MLSKRSIENMISLRINVFVNVVSMILAVTIFRFVNQYPLTRFPNWDSLWGDSLQVGQLTNIQNNLSMKQFAFIDLNTNLGNNVYNDLNTHVSPLSIFNLLLYEFNPEQIIAFRTGFFIWILLIGSFYYLHSILEQTHLAMILAPLVLVLPVNWGFSYLTPLGNAFMSLPLFLFFLRRLAQLHSSTNILRLIILFIITINSVIVFMIFAPVFLFYFFLNLNVGTRQKLLRSSLLFFAMISCSLYYILPLFQDLSFNKTLSIFELSKSGNISAASYFLFVGAFGLYTILLPLEGSGLILYVPIFMLLVSLYSLIKFRKTNEKIYSEIRILFLLSLAQFIIPLVLYSTPMTRSVLPSYFRFQFNLIPYFLLFSTFMSFSLLLRFSKVRTIASIISVSAILDFIFFVLDPFKFYPLTIFFPEGTFPLRKWLNGFDGNYIFESFLTGFNPWKLTILLNLIIACFIFLVLKQSLLSKKVTSFLLLFSISLSLFSIPIHLYSRQNMYGSQFIAKDSTRLENYSFRQLKWRELINISDPNFRFLPTGIEYSDGSGRNTKLLLDTELSRVYSQNTIFAYRETSSPFVKFTHGLLSGNNFASQYFPPTVNQILANKEIIEMLGVKYIISADQSISDVDFQLIDTVEVNFPNSPESDDSGFVSLYRYLPAKEIARFVDRFEFASDLDFRNSLMSKNTMPDLSKIAVISTNQNLSSLNKKYRDFNNSRPAPSVIRLSNNQIRIKFSKSYSAGFMTVAFDFSPNWRCYSGSKKLSTYRVNGNFIGIPIAPSQSLVNCKYTSFGFYQGLISLLVLLLGISFWHARCILIREKLSKI